MGFRKRAPFYRAGAAIDNINSLVYNVKSNQKKEEE